MTSVCYLYLIFKHHNRNNKFLKILSDILWQILWMFNIVFICCLVCVLNKRLFVKIMQKMQVWNNLTITHANLCNNYTWEIMVNWLTNQPMDQPTDQPTDCDEPDWLMFLCQNNFVIQILLLTQMIQYSWSGSGQILWKSCVQSCQETGRAKFKTCILPTALCYCIRKLCTMCNLLKTTMMMTTAAKGLTFTQQKG